MTENGKYDPVVSFRTEYKDFCKKRAKKLRIKKLSDYLREIFAVGVDNYEEAERRLLERKNGK